jgi:endonuclease/exonuclease/phosphatase family metal-dependent hydrolase
MKMILKLIIVCLLCVLIVAVLYFAGVIIYATLTEFKPGPTEIIPVKLKKSAPTPVQQELNLFSWNIGYGGLGIEMDFFYEGGKMVRPSESQYIKYIEGISEVIADHDSVDFFLFQEVDFNSRRSYFQDQAEILFSQFDQSSSVTAVNYKSEYVPVPYLNPMGKVNSGLAVISKYQPFEALRISSPASYSWPKKLFLPKRCLLITKFRISAGHDLVVINLHNSAFDDADALRDEELKLIRKFALDEFSKGNYVVAGGDWNQNPPGLEISDIGGYKLKPLRPIPQDLMPEGWNWAFDGSLPTNRDVDKPFDKTSTNCTTIDFFLVSPNIEVLKTRTLDLGFENSDHLPVLLKIRLKDE